MKKILFLLVISFLINQSLFLQQNTSVTIDSLKKEINSLSDETGVNNLLTKINSFTGNIDTDFKKIFLDKITNIKDKLGLTILTNIKDNTKIGFDASQKDSLQKIIVTKTEKPEDLIKNIDNAKEEIDINNILNQINNLTANPDDNLKNKFWDKILILTDKLTGDTLLKIRDNTKLTYPDDKKNILEVLAIIKLSKSQKGLEDVTETKINTTFITNAINFKIWDNIKLSFYNKIIEIKETLNIPFLSQLLKNSDTKSQLVLTEDHKKEITNLINSKTTDLNNLKNSVNNLSLNNDSLKTLKDQMLKQKGYLTDEIKLLFFNKIKDLITLESANNINDETYQSFENIVSICPESIAINDFNIFFKFWRHITGRKTKIEAYNQLEWIFNNFIKDTNKITQKQKDAFKTKAEEVKKIKPDKSSQIDELVKKVLDKQST